MPVLQIRSTSASASRPDGVHDERLLRGRHRLGARVPEPDQQVGREPDEAPADEEQQEVPRLHEHQHREDEERHVREVPALLVVADHVPHPEYQTISPPTRRR